MSGSNEPATKSQGSTLAPLALTAYAKGADRVRALAGGYQASFEAVEAAEFVLVVANLAGEYRVANRVSRPHSQQTPAGDLIGDVWLRTATKTQT